MKGRITFTYLEAEKIKKLIKEKLIATKEQQKKIRNEIRDSGFYMTDFSSKKGYTVADFEKAITIVEYDMAEHTHRFAVWAAARAVQRSFTKTKAIEAAIDKSGLREFVEKSECKNENEFDAFHKKCVNKLIAAFKKINGQPCSYGRAAKIIAIYLKTAVVIASKGKDKRCQFIHPPLDSILLSNLSAKKELKQLKNIRWTQIDKVRYNEIVSIIRNSPYPFNWKLEEYWEV